MEKQVITAIGLIITLITILAAPNLPISIHGNDDSLYQYYEEQIVPISHKITFNLISLVIKDNEEANIVTKFLPIIVLSIFIVILSFNSFSDKHDKKLIYKDRADIYRGASIFTIFAISLIFLNQNLSLSVMRLILSFFTSPALISIALALSFWILVCYLIFIFITQILNPGFQSFRMRHCELKLLDRSFNKKDNSFINIFLFVFFIVFKTIENIEDLCFNEEIRGKKIDNFLKALDKAVDFVSISSIYVFYFVLELTKYVTISMLIILLLYSSRPYTDKTLNDFSIKLHSIFMTSK